MVRKLRQGRLTYKEEREFVAAVERGASLAKLAIQFKISIAAAERKCRALGVQATPEGANTGGVPSNAARSPR